MVRNSNQTLFTTVKCLDLNDSSINVNITGITTYVGAIEPKRGHTYKFWCYANKNMADTTMGMTGSSSIYTFLRVASNYNSSDLYNHTSSAYWNGSTLVAKDSFLYTY